jgi:hypothetical protein
LKKEKSAREKTELLLSPPPSSARHGAPRGRRPASQPRSRR